MTITRDYSQNPLFATLGFFVQGLPAIFVRSEIAFCLEPNMKHYIENAFEKGGVDFSNDETRRGCEQFMTVTHELRHFHDALLSRPLFKLFMLQSARLWSIRGLLNQTVQLRAADIPFRDRQTALSKFIPAGQFCVNQIYDADQKNTDELRILFASHPCLDTLTISLVDLLETNAMVAELLHVHLAHGCGFRRNRPPVRSKSAACPVKSATP